MTDNSFNEPAPEANPLEALGLGNMGGNMGGDMGGNMGGGMDMGALLQQAQQMQQQLQQAQQQLAEAMVEGTAGGEAVTVSVSGVGDLEGVVIKPGGFDGNNEEDLTDLGDLIVAAYRDAKTRADAKAAETLGPMAQMLGGGAQGPGAGPGGAGAGGLPGLG
jgi:nucleoid-associated protein EbfC